MQTKDFGFEIKSADDLSGTLEGYASVYNVVDSYKDVVMPGAFDKTIAARGGKVVILANHEPASSIGLATLHDTSKGLRVRAKLLLALPEARDAYERVKAGLVTGLSIGYYTKRESFKGGVRQLHEVDLHEVSLVPFPACDPARIDAVKSDRRVFEPIWRALDAHDDEAALRNLAATVRDMKRTLTR
jgi:HK97 family phage prohead protease